MSFDERVFSLGNEILMRLPKARLTIRTMIVAVAVLAVSLGALRAWRKQVYCSGWAAVWALNEEQMQREAGQARLAHNDERAVFCEAEASRYARLRHEYERTANRFWEPVPTHSPRPPELR